MKEKIIKILQEAATHDEAADKIHLLYNPKADIDFDAFLKWFNDVTGKRIRKLDDKSKGQIRSRIGEGYSKHDLVRAVKNCLSDPFHQDNKQYLTPEFISRPDKFVKYLYYRPRVLPSDWYNRQLTDSQLSMLTEEQKHQWLANKAAVEMGGGRLKPIQL